MGTQGWREETDAGDYFLHQQKQLQVADRRPVIKKGSDLVGPGIAANAVRITDFDNLLATFNGYYSAAPGALGAPNTTEAFVGFVISDATLGGRQVFTGLTSGIEYSRTFTRSPVDPEALGWSNWTGQRILPSLSSGTDTTLTTVNSGVATVLVAPSVSVIGEPGVYDRSDAGVRVYKQGVYTGDIHVGSTLSGVTGGQLFFYRPDGNQTIMLGQTGVAFDNTVRIPFTCWATDGLQGFSLLVYHTSGADRDFWYRISITRVGDAV